MFRIIKTRYFHIIQADERNEYGITPEIMADREQLTYLLEEYFPNLNIVVNKSYMIYRGGAEDYISFYDYVYYDVARFPADWTLAEILAVVAKQPDPLRTHGQAASGEECESVPDNVSVTVLRYSPEVLA